MKVMFSGSRNISYIPAKIKNNIIKVLQELIDSHGMLNIIVGDCLGADYEIQKLILEEFRTEIRSWGTVNIDIYYVGNEPRNAVKEARYKKIIGSVQTLKDLAMCNDCDLHIALWDGQSEGTLKNIQKIARLGKESRIIGINGRV